MTRLLAVYDGSNNLVMRFTYADGRIPVSMTKSGVTYYLAYDQIGSLRAIMDANGSVIKEMLYDSFGAIIFESNSAFTVPFGFAGGLHDRDTGLVRFGYRDYDPTIGRWVAKDPIDFAGGDLNLYGYVGNEPISWIDPFGLKQVMHGTNNGRPVVINTETGVMSNGFQESTDYASYNQAKDTALYFTGKLLDLVAAFFEKEGAFFMDFKEQGIDLNKMHNKYLEEQKKKETCPR
jgi:RHS repeat-associated protein